MKAEISSGEPVVHRSVPCFHGGAFFAAIGDEFESLRRRHDVINADVLDAWFPPSPKVIAALNEALPWLLRTSPPTHSEGLARVIARVRGVLPENILPGAGSSDLIFLALRQWLNPSSRVLILDPMYGEYAHVLERVIDCHVARLPLLRSDHYRANLAELRALADYPYDLIVLVNPNSPTGQHIPRAELEEVLRRVPAKTVVWVDETYVDYVAPTESLEVFAEQSKNVVVCKSMSKVYALSGARVAYLCGSARILDGLRGLAPPWSVSLLAQVAAVAALQDPDYYAARWLESHGLRERLFTGLSRMPGLEILPAVANFLLCHLPAGGPDAATVVQRCRTKNLFVRDVGGMGKNLGPRALRIAVKDAATTDRMVEILATAVGGEPREEVEDNLQLVESGR